MRYYIIIPAHNEADFIGLTLQSLTEQTLLPKKVVVVDDNSTDNTAEIISSFTKHNTWITLIQNHSSNKHLPGSKIIQAFNKGLESLDENYDMIVKLDADLIVPKHYFETIVTIFKTHPNVGIAGGVAYIKKKNNWILENLTDNDHIRGGFKSYRKECFLQIGKLKPAMGWDTADELLARYYNWKITVNSNLKIKLLRPTGLLYEKTNGYKQGEAFFALRYGFILTLIASIKLAIMKRKPLLFIAYIKGFFNAKKNAIHFLVNENQGKFIRNYRWRKIKSKLFLTKK